MKSPVSLNRFRCRYYHVICQLVLTKSKERKSYNIPLLKKYASVTWISFRMTNSDRSSSICFLQLSKCCSSIAGEKRKKLLQNKNSNYKISWLIGKERVYIMLMKGWSFSGISYWKSTTQFCKWKKRGGSWNRIYSHGEKKHKIDTIKIKADGK